MTIFIRNKVKLFILVCIIFFSSSCLVQHKNNNSIIIDYLDSLNINTNHDSLKLLLVPSEYCYTCKKEIFKLMKTNKLNKIHIILIEGEVKDSVYLTTYLKGNIINIDKTGIVYYKKFSFLRKHELSYYLIVNNKLQYNSVINAENVINVIANM